MTDTLMSRAHRGPPEVDLFRFDLTAYLADPHRSEDILRETGSGQAVSTLSTGYIASKGGSYDANYMFFLKDGVAAP